MSRILGSGETSGDPCESRIEFQFATLEPNSFFPSIAIVNWTARHYPLHTIAIQSANKWPSIGAICAPNHFPFIYSVSDPSLRAQFTCRRNMCAVLASHYSPRCRPILRAVARAFEARALLGAKSCNEATQETSKQSLGLDA